MDADSVATADGVGRMAWMASHRSLATAPKSPGALRRLWSSVTPNTTAKTERGVTARPPGFEAKIGAEEEDGAIPALAVKILRSAMSHFCRVEEVKRAMGRK